MIDGWFNNNFINYFYYYLFHFFLSALSQQFINLAGLFIQHCGFHFIIQLHYSFSCLIHFLRVAFAVNIPKCYLLLVGELNSSKEWIGALNLLDSFQDSGINSCWFGWMISIWIQCLESNFNQSTTSKPAFINFKSPNGWRQLTNQS